MPLPRNGERTALETSLRDDGPSEASKSGLVGEAGRMFALIASLLRPYRLSLAAILAAMLVQTAMTVVAGRDADSQHG